MTLREQQSEFVLMVAKLILHANAQGYGLTFGEAWRRPNGPGHSNSLHKLRLAIDLNLFINGVYQTTTEAHAELGEYWESMGGSWGGRFGDGNHYAIAYGGMR